MDRPFATCSYTNCTNINIHALGLGGRVVSKMALYHRCQNDLFEMTFVSGPVPSIRRISDSDLSCLLSINSVHRSNGSCGWTSDAGEWLSRRLFDGPANIPVTSSNNLHDCIKQHTVFELWYKHLSREAERSLHFGHFRIATVCLWERQKNRRICFFGELTRQCAQGALFTQTQFGQL